MAKLDLDAIALGRVTEPVFVPEGGVGPDDYERVERLFDEARDLHPNSKFLDSIYNWWKTKKFLTAKQYEALRNLTVPQCEDENWNGGFFHRRDNR